MTLKPGGSFVTRSPWLIQTGFLSPGCQTPSNRAEGCWTRSSARPNSRWWPEFDRAAELLGHGLLAVADAQHRHLRGEDGGVGRGAWPSITEAGPPESTMALGSNCFSLAWSTDWKGWICSRPGFAQAAGDQLGDLGTKIDDQQTVGHGGIYGTPGRGSTGIFARERVMSGPRASGPAHALRSADLQVRIMIMSGPGGPRSHERARGPRSKSMRRRASGGALPRSPASS